MGGGGGSSKQIVDGFGRVRNCTQNGTHVSGKLVGVAKGYPYPSNASIYIFYLRGGLGTCVSSLHAFVRIKLLLIM